LLLKFPAAYVIFSKWFSFKIFSYVKPIEKYLAFEPRTGTG
jgi:hypothetical protein